MLAHIDRYIHTYIHTYIQPKLPRIQNIITISPCTVEFSGSGGGGKGGKKKGASSGAAAAAASSLPYAPNDAIYDRFEDELFAQVGR